MNHEALPETTDLEKERRQRFAQEAVAFFKLANDSEAPDGMTDYYMNQLFQDPLTVGLALEAMAQHPELAEEASWYLARLYSTDPSVGLLTWRALLDNPVSQEYAQTMVDEDYEQLYESAADSTQVERDLGDLRSPDWHSDGKQEVRANLYAARALTVVVDSKRR